MQLFKEGLAEPGMEYRSPDTWASAFTSLSLPFYLHAV